MLPMSRVRTPDVLAEAVGFEPTMRFNPHTPLAGEPLQPLGHASKYIFQYDREFITPYPDVGLVVYRIIDFFTQPSGVLSSSKALCKARTASSMYLS